MYSLILSDIFTAFAGVTHFFVLGDVTYGAYCVDDLSALALVAGLLIHYGYSCLVPIDATKVPCLYVFVDIKIVVERLISTIKLNLNNKKSIVHAGTVQFASAIREAKPELQKLGLSVLIPQSKPLSAGEILGCTAPRISSKSVIGSFSDMAVIACPRLSIDWGEAFEKPLLTPFEAEIAVGDLPAAKGVKGVGDSLAGDYPMDYYAQDGGEWNSSYLKKATRPIRRNVVSSTSDGAAL
ncbi:hypothetical protein GH714_001926 [Hevea brasiliensis]|uniref:2-(3-amino-3-carboxypropyl)histidine synthase subunit 1 n=1 Tax=Hevea brasiliensis TaxID=3981 RepID=A0A6A6MA62_HEVBR|nr:hypothetical protein GH714_001926 [Hevea brasiliensis]